MDILPFGPLTIGVLLVVLGFVCLTVYLAVWRGVSLDVLVRDYLAMTVVVSFVGVLAYVLFAKTTEVVDILIGALIAAFSAVVAVYFNSNQKGE
jgi:hypothetical protein